MGYFAGITYVLLWYSSILGGYAGLFCPIFPLIFVSNRLYRSTTDFLFTFWQMYPTVLLELLGGCKVSVSGDPVATDETALLVMNHRTRTDWNFFWPAAYYSAQDGPGRLTFPTKFVLKDEIRHVPGIGWVMQLACFLYIKRNWLVDKIRMENMVDYLCSWNHKFCILIFPEGTDLTAQTKAKSDLFAEKSGLQKFEYVLHPRTTGFSYLAHRLLQKGALQAIYDVTLIYSDLIPQNERMILAGKFPKEVRFHFHKYPADKLPQTEDELKVFLEKCWQQKELSIKEYYASRQFRYEELKLRTNRAELYLALVFWTFLPGVVVYLLVVWRLFRNVVLGHTVFLLLINYFSGGFQNFELGLHNAKRRLAQDVMGAFRKYLVNYQKGV